MPRISRLLEGAALARIQARLREEAVNAIEEAYAAIDVGTACAMCGVEPLQLNELAERCGWRSEGDVLVISRVSRGQRNKCATTGGTGYGAEMLKVSRTRSAHQARWKGLASWTSRLCRSTSSSSNRHASHHSVN